MKNSDVSAILDSKALISVISILAGTLIGNLIAVLRARLRVLEYTVSHDRVALSADDPVFGEVRVTWQGHQVTNLFSSTVQILNDSTHDYANLKLKVFTGNETLLLTEAPEMGGTSYVLKWTNEFAEALRVEPGKEVSDQQFRTYYHSREYLVPTLNRGQRISLRFITTVPSGQNGPAVWVDMLHPGVRIQFRPTAPAVHGAPLRVALAVGLLVCLIVTLAASLYSPYPWIAAVVCMFFGLGAQIIGALTYRLMLVIKRLLVR